MFERREVGSKKMFHHVRSYCKNFLAKKCALRIIAYPKGFILVVCELKDLVHISGITKKAFILLINVSLLAVVGL